MIDLHCPVCEFVGCDKRQRRHTVFVIRCDKGPRWHTMSVIRCAFALLVTPYRSLSAGKDFRRNANRFGTHVRSTSLSCPYFRLVWSLFAAGPRSPARQAGPTEISDCALASPTPKPRDNTLDLEYTAHCIDV